MRPLFGLFAITAAVVVCTPFLGILEPSTGPVDPSPLIIQALPMGNIVLQRTASESSKRPVPVDALAKFVVSSLNAKEEKSIDFSDSFRNGPTDLSYANVLIAFAGT